MAWFCPPADLEDGGLLSIMGCLFVWYWLATDKIKIIAIYRMRITLLLWNNFTLFQRFRYVIFLNFKRMLISGVWYMYIILQSVKKNLITTLVFASAAA